MDILDFLAGGNAPDLTPQPQTSQGPSGGINNEPAMGQADMSANITITERQTPTASSLLDFLTGKYESAPQARQAPAEESGGISWGKVALLATVLVVGHQISKTQGSNPAVPTNHTIRIIKPRPELGHLGQVANMAQAQDLKPITPEWLPTVTLGLTLASAGAKALRSLGKMKAPALPRPPQQPAPSLTPICCRNQQQPRPPKPV